MSSSTYGQAPPTKSELLTASAMTAAARKRRAQKLASRTANAASQGGDVLPPKKRKFVVETSEGAFSGNIEHVPVKNYKTVAPVERNGESTLKKSATQRRYEPDVPMTKEQASAWRREQRRVRNRESAAASRAKTKGRIAELESELQTWKARYEEMASRVHSLEEQLNRRSEVVSTTCVQGVQEASSTEEVAYSVDTKGPNVVVGQDPGTVGIVSPTSSPLLAPKFSPPCSQNVPFHVKSKAITSVTEQSSIQGTEQHHIIEMINRPAKSTIPRIIDLKAGWIK